MKTIMYSCNIADSAPNVVLLDANAISNILGEVGSSLTKKATVKISLYNSLSSNVEPPKEQLRKSLLFIHTTGSKDYKAVSVKALRRLVNGRLVSYKELFEV